MTTGKTIALTIQTFVDNVMTLLFNTLSRFVIGFPGGSDSKESACNVDNPDSVSGWEDPREKEMATPSSNLVWGKSHGQRSLKSYGPRGRKE